jgi:hydroxymethylglutaryl-CoA reductase
MKYLITESKLDSIIFDYLDNQDFVIIKMQNRLYYVNSEGDEYAQIRYHPKDRWCTINYDLADEVSKFFSLDYSDSIRVINRWTENKLGIKSINVEVASPIVGY